jgi:DNA-binding Lrp family transcriptional regulator
MDEIDHRLIALLRSDARASLSELAKKLGVSRGTVQNRMRRLVSDGVIAGFTVRLRNASAERIRAIMLVEVAGRSTNKVAQALKGLPEIRELHSTNGPFDLVAEIEVGNLADFDRVLSKVRMIDGVARSETSLLLSPA